MNVCRSTRIQVVMLMIFSMCVGSSATKLTLDDVISGIGQSVPAPVWGRAVCRRTTPPRQAPSTSAAIVNELMEGEYRWCLFSSTDWVLQRWAREPRSPVAPGVRLNTFRPNGQYLSSYEMFKADRGKEYFLGGYLDHDWQRSAFGGAMGRVWTDGPLTTLLKSLKNVQISEEGTMVHVSGDSAKSTEHYAIDFDRARGFLAMSFLETKPLPAGELRTEYVIRDAKAINGTWTATSAFVSSGFYRKTAPPFTNDFVIDYFDIAPYEGKDWPAHIPAIPKGSIVGSTDGSLYRADAKHEWHYWAQMGRSRHGIDFGTGMMLAFSAGTAILIVLWRVLTARKRVSNH